MQVSVRLAPVLAALADGRASREVDLSEGATVADALAEVTGRFPAVGRRVQDEQGAVRRHVNVFVGPDNIRDLDGLTTPLTDGVEITVLPAISGG